MKYIEDFLTSQESENLNRVSVGSNRSLTRKIKTITIYGVKNVLKLQGIRKTLLASFDGMIGGDRDELGIRKFKQSFLRIIWRLANKIIPDFKIF